jgi:hypothetical protein
MNLNNETNKKTIFAVSAIIIVLYTLAFFIVRTTPVFITAYIFAIIGVALLCYGNLYFVRLRSGYPWAAAVPLTMWRYLITSTLLSAVFVIIENIIPDFLQRFHPALRIPLPIFIIAHLVVLAFYFVMLILMKTGKEHIERVDEKVAVKRLFIQELQVELSSIKENVPVELKKDIQSVIDAVRYSDPMSNEAVAALEDDIQTNVIRMGQIANHLNNSVRPIGGNNSNDGGGSVRTERVDDIRELCVVIQKMIKDRNNRVKMYK